MSKNNRSNVSSPQDERIIKVTDSLTQIEQNMTDSSEIEEMASVATKSKQTRSKTKQAILQGKLVDLQPGLFNKNNNALPTKGKTSKNNNLQTETAPKGLDSSITEGQKKSTEQTTENKKSKQISPQSKSNSEKDEYQPGELVKLLNPTVTGKTNFVMTVQADEEDFEEDDDMSNEGSELLNYYDDIQESSQKSPFKQQKEKEKSGDRALGF